MAISVGESFKELTALLHDRQIRAVIGVEYIVDTDFFECADQLAHGRVLIFEADLLAPGRTDCRRDLYDRDDLRVCERVVEIQSVIPFTQCTDRTMRDALTTERTVAFREWLIIFETDRRSVPGTDQRPDTHALHFFTDLDAAHALHTFGSIAHQRQIAIPTAHFCRILIV